MTATAVTYTFPSGQRPAVDDCTLAIASGEVVGLIGASGSGKTTLARCLSGRLVPDAGHVGFTDDHDLRSGVGLLPQNAWASMNPRMTLFDVVTEPLAMQGAGPTERTLRYSKLADMVRLAPELARRYPAQISGGQARKAAIARALCVLPRVLILDEPLAGLDLSAQLEALQLARGLVERGLVSALVLVVHDVLAASRYCDRLLVMESGKVKSSPCAGDGAPGDVSPLISELIAAVPGKQLRSKGLE